MSNENPNAQFVGFTLEEHTSLIAAVAFSCAVYEIATKHLGREATHHGEVYIRALNKLTQKISQETREEILRRAHLEVVQFMRRTVEEHHHRNEDQKKCTHPECQPPGDEEIIH